MLILLAIGNVSFSDKFWINHSSLPINATITELSIISDVTVLLSLTVFLNQVSDSMPNTSDAVPLISEFIIIKSVSQDRAQLSLKSLFKSNCIIDACKVKL